VVTILLGALLAPTLFWSAQWLIGHGLFGFLSRFDFETFFHRALLIAALFLLWPLLRSLRLGNLGDLGLKKNPDRARDVVVGFILSAVPLLCCGAVLLWLHIYSVRDAIKWAAVAKVIGAAAVVPVIEEIFFRGLVLGIFLRSGRTRLSVFVTSALYSIVHFLKAPERTSTVVTWTSGFNSIAHSLVQFANPILVAAGFTTLFLIGWVLADARLRTRSLWLPVGLHAGWILASGVFNKIAQREIIALPWLGRSLLVGIVPLGLAGLTWLLMRGRLRYVGARTN
jgi:CAAX protease family protein